MLKKNLALKRQLRFFFFFFFFFCKLANKAIQIDYPDILIFTEERV